MHKLTAIRLVSLVAFIVGISLLHYVTPLSLPYLHAIFQRLYYLPIILAALWFGLRGGLVCALVASMVYAPHILFQWGGEFAMEAEKYLEMVLYNLVGCMTGFLSQRERQRAEELQKTASGLEESYRKLQQQSERIIVIEEQLRRAEKLSTLGEMAAVLAHEIRNPLGSIRGTAEILKDDYSSDDPKKEFIDIQIRETERLNRVVEDFLHMARPQPTDMRPCRVQEEIETIASLVANDSKVRGVRLSVLPAAETVMVSADGEKLRQAFLNIVLNALQATTPGGTVTISTTVVDATSCEIEFADTGSGIEAATLDRIFEPFFTTKPEGTGLGLAITKKIVESHGGALTIESSAGVGTTITIRLPLQEKLMEGHLETKNTCH
ncbi:sensor histidine kinase [Geomonas subterranea]|uniref:histidine kinase n=1 Tax=Geomonas subterranea TaxID=2847989 RepID=A0ABX8LLZ1_9BACT|nr:ATP-binding protein [Geomonas subterranea]QXE93051.1 sensor histidine kinase [Geomonas subterranea]QXM11719.1 sensor histidine kinase [Geomonas subterranea]